MAPYSHSAEVVPFENDGDGRRTNLGQNNRITDLGFTAPLIESISKSKTKLQHWAEHEMSTADVMVESYLESHMQQEKLINSQVSELVAVQRERGLNDEIFESTKENNDEDHNDEAYSENNALKKTSLEEQSAKVQIEIIKLNTERENRGKRVQDIGLEESKQRIRAMDAAALKRTAEESKKTTIDDLTRGIVNYNKLGLKFTQTGRDAELHFFFTQLDPGDPLRTFSFVLRVNDDEKYDVYNCEPNIDSNELAEILEELNGSEREDMSMLARRMRRAFKKSVRVLESSTTK